MSFGKVKARIRRWWIGEYVPPHEVHGVAFLMGHHERHWTSVACGVVVDFLAREWKWTVGIMIALAALGTRL